MIRDEYERKSSPVKAFIKDCLELDNISVETKEDVYNQYKNFCNLNNLPIKPNNSFARELKQNIIALDEEQLHGGKRAWIGIRII